MINEKSVEKVENLLKRYNINSCVIKDIEGSSMLEIGDPCSLHFCDKFSKSLDSLDFSVCSEKEKIREEIKREVIIKKCPIELLHIAAPLFIDGKYIGIIFVPPWRLSEKIPTEKLEQRIKDLRLEKKKREIFEEYEKISLLSADKEIEAAKSEIKMIAEVITSFMNSEYLNMINTLLRTINIGEFDWKEIITTITKMSRKITRADRSCLLLLEPTTNKLTREFHCEQFEEKKEHCYKHVNSEEGAIGHVFRTGEPLLIRDTEEEQRWQFSTDVKSTLYVPLKNKGNPIGVIHVVSYKKYAFHRWHQQILTIFGEAAELTIHNASLFKNNQKIIEKLESLYTRNLSLVSEHELKLLFQQICTTASELFGADAIIIYSWDQNLRQFQLEFSYGVNIPSKLVGPMIPEKSIKLKVIEKGESCFFITDSKHDEIMKGEFVEREGIESSAALILNNRDEKVGLMFVNYRSRHYFSDEEKQLYRLFALQVASAIRNVQSFREIESQKRKAITILSQISSLIQIETDLDKMFYTILTGITIEEGLAFNRAIVFLKDNYRNILEGKMAVGPTSNEDATQLWEKIKGIKFSDCISEYDKKKILLLESDINRMAKRIVIPLVNENLFTRILREGKPINIKDAIKECPEVYELMGNLSVDAFAIAPLISENKPIGIIVADRKYNHMPIKDFDLELLSLFANQSAMAIKKRALFNRLSLRIKNLDELFATMSIEYNTIENFLKDIGNIIVKVLNVSWNIYLFEEKRNMLVLAESIEEDDLILNPTEVKIGEGTIGTVALTNNAVMGDTFIVIPIKKHTELLGVMQVYKLSFKPVEPFTDDEKKFTEVVGNYIALVISNLKLIQELNILAEQIRNLSMKTLHRMGNKIFPFAGRIEIVNKYISDLELAKGTKDVILENLRIMADLLEEIRIIRKDFLFMTKPLPTELQWLEINDLLEKVISELKPSFKKIKIKFSPQKDLPYIKGDIGLLKESFLELGLNAKNFISPGGEFKVSTRILPYNENINYLLPEDQLYLCVEITNTGSGIPQELKEKIFEPFFTTRGSAGFGLGLSFVRRIIEGHKGLVREEGIPDKGAKFVVILPIS